MRRCIACICLAGAVCLVACGGDFEARDSHGARPALGRVAGDLGPTELRDACRIGLPRVVCDSTGVACEGENHVCCFLGDELICVASATDCARAATKAASKVGRAWECDDSSDCPGRLVCCADGAAGDVPWARTCKDRCRDGRQLCAQDCECGPDAACAGGSCRTR